MLVCKMGLEFWLKTIDASTVPSYLSNGYGVIPKDVILNCTLYMHYRCTCKLTSLHTVTTWWKNSSSSRM